MKIDPLIGTQFAGYRIEEQLGRGGMGVVYRAEHVLLGRKDAVKLLVPELSADESFRERFLRESRLAAAIEHPNIIPIYHAGNAEGHLYIAMRYVRGPDLRTLLKTEGALAPELAAAIVEQVAGALDAAHARGLVHRDVKPANILMAPTGLVYLSDFGIAKHTATVGGLTKTGSFLGTLDYSAPEQIEGKPLDGRADLYALACVLYQCLTGAVPYDKDSDVQIMYAHLSERPPHPTSKQPNLPPQVDSVLDRALAKAPADRFETCGAFATAFKAALVRETARAAPQAGVAETPSRVPEERPPPAPPPARPVHPEAAPPVARPHAPEPPTPVWRRRPVALVAAGAVALAIGVGVLLASRGGSSSFPNGAETTLLSYVPAGLRGSCTRVTSTAGSAARVACGPANQRVTYTRFADSADLTQYYRGRVPGDLARDRGNCAGPPWSGERTYAIRGRIAGRVFCALASPRATIGWTDTGARIYAQAARRDADQKALYRTWRTAWGPLAVASSRSTPRKSAALAHGAIILSDDFSSRANGWPNGSDARYVGGDYQVVGPPGQGYYVSTADLQPSVSFAAVRVAVEASRVAGAGNYSFGAVCRSVYALQVQRDGVLLISKLTRDGSLQPLKASRPFPGLLRRTNRLHAECLDGGRLLLTVNGRRFSARDPKPVVAAGSVGMIATGGTGRVEVRFDNLVVRQP